MALLWPPTTLTWCIGAPDNVARLLDALRSINAQHWEHAASGVAPDERDLLLRVRHSLQTDLGPIDILGQIGSGRSYDDLLPDSVRIEIAPAWGVQALCLRAMIETKRETGRPKDLLALQVLEETMAESDRLRAPEG